MPLQRAEPEGRIQRVAGSAVLLLLAIVSLAIPTVFSASTIESGRVKLLVLHLAIAAMFVVMAAEAARTGRLRFPRHPLHLAVGAWLLLNVTSAIASPYPYTSLGELWRLTMWVALYGVVVYAARTARSIRLIAWLCVIATALVVSYGIAQRVGYDIVTYDQSPQDRVFSSLGNPNMLAGFLLLMLWTTVGVALDTRSIWLRATPALLVAGMLWCLVYTYTKGAWIAQLTTDGLTSRDALAC